MYVHVVKNSPVMCKLLFFHIMIKLKMVEMNVAK